MKHLYALLILAIFALGVGVGGFISIQIPTQDTPAVQTYSATSRALSFNSVQLADPSDTQPLRSVPSVPVYDGPIERASPGNWIKESQIEMKPDGVFIHLNNPQWAILAGTKSMDPVFDQGAHLIQEVPSNADQIHVGDIMSYDSPLGFTIVHRVIEIGNDSDGWYAIAKGDNNPTPDPWKIRFDSVRRVTVMIVY